MFSENTNKFNDMFKQKYDAWIKYITHPSIRETSEVTLFTKGKEYREVIDLGVKAIPLILVKVEDKKEGYYFLRQSIYDILKYKNNAYYDKGTKSFVFIDFPEFDIQKQTFFDFWWYKGRKKIPQILKTRYEEYKQLKSRRDIKGAEEKLQKIQNLGYDGLPVMIEMVKSGEADLIPVISMLTASEK